MMDALDVGLELLDDPGWPAAAGQIRMLQLRVEELEHALIDADARIADAEAGGRLACEQVLVSHETAMDAIKTRETEILAKVATAMAQLCEIQRLLGVRA